MQKQFEKQIAQPDSEALKAEVERAIQNMPESDKKILTYELRGKIPAQHLRQTSQVLPEMIQKTRHLRQIDPEWTNTLLGKLKSSFNPAFTKHGQNYPGNPYGLCHFLSLLWLRAHLELPARCDTNPRFKKSDFFSQTTNQYMPKPQSTPTEAEEERVKYELAQRLNDRKFAIPETFTPVPTCENFIGTPVAGIYTVSFDQLAQRIVDIASQSYAVRKNIFIHIGSIYLNHAMALFIRIHHAYVSVVFYNPDSTFGDAKIALPVMMNEPVQIQRIRELIDFSGLKCPPNTDFTLICLNTNQDNNIQLRPNFLVEDHLYSQCLLTIATSGNTGPYFDAMRQILQHPSMQDPDILNACSDNKGTGLCQAAQCGHTNLVQLLTSQPEINLDGSYDPKNIPPLYMASQYGHAEVVRILVSKPDININAYSPNGSNPLLIASQQGHADIVKLLVAQPRINLDVCTAEKVTPLILATYGGHLEIVRILLAQPSINPNEYMSNVTNPLLLAVQQGHADIVRLLVSQPKINLNARLYYDGATPLLLASEDNNAEIVGILAAQKNIHINASYLPNAMTALHLAAEKGYIEIVKILVATNGIDLNRRTTNGATALSLASQQGHLEIVKILSNFMERKS